MVEWLVFHKANQEYIGFTGLKYLEDLKEVDLGYRFKKAYWGQGLATESCRPFLKYGFEKLGLNKIVGMTHPEKYSIFECIEKS